MHELITRCISKHVTAKFSSQHYIDLDKKSMGVVGWCEGAVYLTSPGRPTDIGLQLGKACYPCSG